MLLNTKQILQQSLKRKGEKDNVFIPRITIRASICRAFPKRGLRLCVWRMKDEDKTAMRRELDRYKNASSPMEKNDAVNKLDDLTEKYGLFTHGFMLNIAGHDQDDPVRANKALVAFNQFMAALNEGNVQRARDILSANEHLIGNINLPATGATTGIGIG